MTRTAIGAMKYPAFDASPSKDNKPRERVVRSTPACIHCRYVLSFANRVFGSTFLERCSFLVGVWRLPKKRLIGFGRQMQDWSSTEAPSTDSESKLAYLQDALSSSCVQRITISIRQRYPVRVAFAWLCNEPSRTLRVPPSPKG